MTNTTTILPLTIQSGLRALNQKRYQEVHTHSLSMIKNNVEDSIPYFLLAVIAYDHKNNQKDILGVIYSRANDHERARIFFKRAVELDGKHANSFYNLGASELFLGNFEQAEVVFLKAIKLDKNHYGAWASLISLSKQTEDSNYLKPLGKRRQT